MKIIMKAGWHVLPAFSAKGTGDVNRISKLKSWLTVLNFSVMSKIKALLGMLARLPRGKRDMLSSMNGKYGGVSVKYASPIVSCH